MEIPGFKVQKWKSYDMYVCDAEECNFDTVEPAQAVNHWEICHMPKPPPKPRPMIPIKTRFGKVIGYKEG